jgi:hypothetical protein
VLSGFCNNLPIFGHNSPAIKKASGLILVIPMFLPTSSKIKLFALCLGSLLFLIGGLKGGNSAGNRERRLLTLTGLAALFYVGLELCWYFYIRFLQSRETALAYYFSWRLWGGIVTAMFLYVIYRHAKVLLTISAVLLVAFNVFVIARHLARSTGLIGIGDGLFGGMFIASLVLLWFDQQDRHVDGETAVQPRTADKKA